MAVLDRKLGRDLRRMWAQVLAIAMVMACGVATIVIAVGAYRSLEETRSVFYDRYRFADIFANAVRAPLQLRDRIAAIPGLSSFELRIVKPLLLDIPALAEPATSIAISLPDHGDPAVNALYIRSGRLPVAGRTDEVAVLENFARAHRMQPGSTFRAIMNGRKRTLTVTGIVLSPEYVYAIGPGDMVPDPRRFSAIFMRRSSLENIFDMQGAFNNVAARTLHGAGIDETIDRLDSILRAYGGTGGHDRSLQASHEFLDNELNELRSMVITIPPIFLFVSAFLINLILSRLIALERPQIGLLKALGYGEGAIAGHYAKFTLVIAAVGIVIGAGLGNWLGRGLTRLYGNFFSFPFLIFRQSTDLYLLAAGITVAAALVGAMRAIWQVIGLAPAVAMQAPAPVRYRALLGSGSRLLRFISQLTIMAVRHLVRWPMRTLMTTAGASLSVALLITALFTFDAVAFMVDVIFYRTERQDATIIFRQELAPRALQAVEHMPGVLRAEPLRSAPVMLRHGHRQKRLNLSSAVPNNDLSRILDIDLRPISPPPRGLVLTERVAHILDVRPGDLVAIEFLDKGGRVAEAPVTGIVQSYVGLGAYMSMEAFDRLLGDGGRLTAAHVSIDRAEAASLYEEIKRTPAVSAIALQRISRQRFRETIESNIAIMTTVYTGLAVIIAFGVVYNSARIQLSERERELASLRVFGFTRGEVSRVLFVEIAAVVLLAQPFGWLFGTAFAWWLIQRMASDLFRVPFVINPQTYAIASLVVLGAAAASALVVRRRIDRLDLVEVLKTRE
jgi:putative ABC transport system permease protein